MLFNYKKLALTKELKNYNGVECVIICQNILDFAAVQMLIDKRVKKIINCVDYFYLTKGYEIISKRDIEIVYLEGKCFQEFDNWGIVDITSKGIIFKEKCFYEYVPEMKYIDSLVEDFVSNTIEYMRKEKDLINNIEISGKTKELKPVSVIISRGEYGREDIKCLKKTIREEAPSIVCVDGGSEIAIKHGIIPDAIIGDMDSISKRTIEASDNFIIHRYLNGKCPGLKRIPGNKKIGFIKCFGTSEDAAILYCIKKGSTKIYTLGFHVNALDYIEKGRRGMSSSLLVRLYYGHKIKDIKGTINTGNNVLYLVSSAALILIILYFSFFSNITLRVFK